MIVHTPCGLPGIIGQSLSIGECLKVCAARDRTDEAFEGPLTDGEDTDGGGLAKTRTKGLDVGPPSHPSQEKVNAPDGSKPANHVISDPSHLSRQEKRIQRYYSRRRLRRAQDQVQGRTGQKWVHKAQCTKAKAEGFVLPTDMALSDRVTRSGWIGVPTRNLPKQVFSREALEIEHGMSYFNWDGR